MRPPPRALLLPKPFPISGAASRTARARHVSAAATPRPPCIVRVQEFANIEFNGQQILMSTFEDKLMYLEKGPDRKLPDGSNTVRRDFPLLALDQPARSPVQYGSRPARGLSVQQRMTCLSTQPVPPVQMHVRDCLYVRRVL